MSKEIMHWADQIALEVKRRVESDKVLQKVVKEHDYFVYDEKTPSGKIHIGSGRGWVIHDVIAKAMRDNGMKAKFVLSSDDIDPFDKMNKELPVGYEKYLGMPFRDIPSPVKGYKNFADYYFKQSTDKFEEFGIIAELESTGEQYDKGVFNKTIKIALDNAQKIRDIYERIHGKPTKEDWLPFNPICEKCGKIGTTYAYEWDSEKELVKYKCLPDLVTWAKGCGHEGEILPYNGNGKFPWKVEWAAKWPAKGVTCELAGKDHFTQGGSRTVAVAISDEVFNYPPPYPSTRKSTGKGYEFFTVGGKKMSTSKGQGIGFVDSTDYAPAHILRYLLVRSRPHAVIDFEPADTNDVILLYDRFDKTERVFFGAEETSDKDKDQQTRIYKLSHIGKIKDKLPVQVQFSHCATIIQVTLDVEKAIGMLKESGHIPKDASKDDIDYVKGRMLYAQKWVKEFAPEQYRFKIQEKADIKLGDNEKKAVEAVIAELKKKHDEKSLFEAFYEIMKKLDMKGNEFFGLFYKILINKEQGPKLAPFMMTIGKERVCKLLSNVL